MRRIEFRIFREDWPENSYDAHVWVNNAFWYLYSQKQPGSQYNHSNDIADAGDILVEAQHSLMKNRILEDSNA